MSRLAAQFDPSTGLSGDVALNLSNRCGGVLVRNESSYGLAFECPDGRILMVGAWEVRAIQFAQPAKSLHWNQVYALNAQGAPVSVVIVEAFDPSEWPPDMPVTLQRQTNVGNTVQTGTSVGQVTNITYDQTAINGEPAGTVTSEAAAGSGAGLVDVTDTNKTGGVRKFVMATGTASIGADGAVTAPAFHGNADSASHTPATGLQAGAIPAGVTIAASQVGSGYPAANLSGSVPSATTASNLGGGITSMDDASNHVTGINPQVPAGVARSILLAPWDGSAQHNSFSVGSSGFHASCWISDIGQINMSSGGTLGGAHAFAGSGSGTYSHGLTGAPSVALVNTNNGSNSTTYGSGSYTASSVFIYQNNAQAFLALAIQA